MIQCNLKKRIKKKSIDVLITEINEAETDLVSKGDKPCLKKGNGVTSVCDNHRDINQRYQSSYRKGSPQT